MTAKKGVVMETGKDWAIILLPDGAFKKIKTRHTLEVGDVYQENHLQAAEFIAAAVILLAILFTSIDYYSVKTYAQVSSMVELGVNRWGRVVSVKATNDQGQQVLKTIEVKNDKLEIAIEKIHSQTLQNQPKTEPGLPKSKQLEQHKRSNSGLEEKTRQEIHHDLQETIQSSKQSDVLKDIVNDKIIPQIQQTPTPIEEIPDLPKLDLNQIEKDNLQQEADQVKEQFDSLESILKDSYEQIDQQSQQDLQEHYSDLKSELENGKNITE